ncbi:MAG: Uma2 family endonuclease [Gemmataceae bacterium]
MSALRTRTDAPPRSTFVANGEVIDVPAWVHDLASFLRWRTGGGLPDSVQICFLDGHIWVDADMEEFFTHNQVKFAFTRVLGNVVVEGDLGRVVPDGMLLASEDANLSCEPDCSFVSHDGFDSGRVEIVEGKGNTNLVMTGAPDMVLEIVSRTSVKKDTVLLRKLYWAAGVPEFWLVDARGDAPQFDILKHAANGYVAARKSAGWLKSAVFGRAFRLTRGTDRRGKPEFRLETR